MEKAKSNVTYLSDEVRHRILIWNNVLQEAAKDLATFTRHGIYAKFISELAIKCETYEQLMKHGGNAKESFQLENEIRSGIKTICKAGQEIWRHHPQKRASYVSPLKQMAAGHR